MQLLMEQTADVTPHPFSGWDEHGRLYESNGELLRGVRAEYAAFYRGLLNSRYIEALFSLGLVRTEIANVTLAGYPLVLRHERVPFLTHWLEWTSLMLVDAAKMLSDLSLELLKRGNFIPDVHIWNVLFNSGDPVFVDFTAILPMHELQTSQRNWLRNWLRYWRHDWALPLTFMSMGYPGVARSMNNFQLVTQPIDRILRRPQLRWFPLWYYRLIGLAHKQPAAFLQRLRSRLQRIPLPSYSAADSRRLSLALDKFEPGSKKNEIVRSLLADLNPPTVIDIGCGDGLYALLAERTGAKVVAFDKDERRMNALYQHVKANRLGITPLLMEFTVPTSAGGKVAEFPSATSRLACDTSLMIDRLHIEVLGWKWPTPFERIAQLLAGFTKRYSIVEFLPPEHEWVAERLTPDRQFYNLSNLVRAMERYFTLTGVFEADSPSKILVFRKSA